MLRDPDGRLEGATSVQAYIAERDIAWVRFALVAFNVIIYWLALPHDPARHPLAAFVTVAASFYAVFVVLVRPYERFHILRTSAYTLVTDSALIALWLYATGGLASPFYGLWAVSLFAVVFRFGPTVVGLATSLYVAVDATMLFVSGDLVRANVPDVVVRAGYILLVGIVGTLLGYRWQASVRARMRLANEVQANDRAVAEADRIRGLTNAAFEGLCIHRQGIILELNDAFCELFGRPREELLGMDVRDLVADDSVDLVEERLANPMDEGYELWIRGAKGRVRVAVQGRAIEYRGQPARVAAVRDITQRFEAEQARALAHEQQVEIDRLRAIDEFRSQFINTAAHELNTPLTPIKIQFATMRDQWQGPDAGMALLERNLDRLANLVHDMLDVARLQSGQVRISPRQVDVIPGMRDVVETFRPSATGRGVLITLDAPEEAEAFVDPDRVVQVVTNLVSNGLKFTPRDGTVTVSVRPSATTMRVEVVDTGPGVPEDQLDSLFQPFGQVHVDPQIPGTGLGLYISKSLAASMGGSVGVANVVDGPGARFWVDLPRTEADAEAAKATTDGHVAAADPLADVDALEAEGGPGVDAFRLGSDVPASS